MKVSSEHPNTRLYLFLLAVQISGAITFVWQELPQFRQLAFNPGKQLPQDPISELATIVVFFVMQISFWYRVQHVPIPIQHPSMVLNHVFLFLGRLSFIFGSALFSSAAFRHLPELGLGTDIALLAWRGMVLIACLFALFCASLEVERLGQAFERRN